jgi:hypothetical protein
MYIDMFVYTQLHDSTKAAAVAEPFRGDVWLCSEGLTSHGEGKPPSNPLLVFLLIQGAFTQSYRGIFLLPPGTTGSRSADHNYGAVR